MRKRRRGSSSLDGALSGDDACGAVGSMVYSGWRADGGCASSGSTSCSSGDTAGTRDEVVGYGAFALYEAA